MRSMMKHHPLRIYREKSALTQGELAAILGVCKATISHIENGRRVVIPKKAIEWETKIGISRADLCPEIFGNEKVGAGATAANVAANVAALGKAKQDA